jgi:hypothetical protein
MAPMLWIAAYCGASHPLARFGRFELSLAWRRGELRLNKPWCIADGIDGGRTLIARVEHTSTIVAQCHSSKVLRADLRSQDREY